jgi:tRNA pseudouridine38-40 synthase
MNERFRVQLSYDGTDFSGSQYQPELRTVQGELEKALEKIAWRGERALFAGRTDAGVHAAGQVVTFDFGWDHTVEELGKALNAVLPADIAATRIQRVQNDFHPRYDAVARRYAYRILNTPVKDPLQERYSWRVWPELDMRLMRKESRYLVGKHDFAALGTPHKTGGSTVREITRARWKKNKQGLVFEIVGNAFLYHMVRRIVMAVVKIGLHQEPAGGIKEFLDNPTGPPAQGLAPAHGLSLEKVEYRA